MDIGCFVDEGSKTFIFGISPHHLITMEHGFGRAFSIGKAMVIQSRFYDFAISKSDGQKLRFWDLSTTNDKNSSRPPYKDIPHTEGTIGCYGAYLFGGAYSQMSVVYLDAEDT